MTMFYSVLWCLGVSIECNVEWLSATGCQNLKRGKILSESPGSLR